MSTTCRNVTNTHWNLTRRAWPGMLQTFKHGVFVLHVVLTKRTTAIVSDSGAGTAVGDSAAAERSWHVVHSNRGPLLLGLWYRPPARGREGLISELDS